MLDIGAVQSCFKKTSNGIPMALEIYLAHDRVSATATERQTGNYFIEISTSITSPTPCDF